MNQSEKRQYLIRYLLNENEQYQDFPIPSSTNEQKDLLRSLVNVRMPQEIDNEFLEVQDAYLQEELNERGITDYKDLESMQDHIYLWQGDITTIKCDAIVNAANSQMTGCYIPCHRCIDNAIHTFAGIQLRNDCDKIIRQQGHEEPTGSAKITPAYNLPCKYVLHTVGPIVRGTLTQNDKDLLASCYRSCLELANENHLESIAFCCISTGEFHFPNEEAAKIAIETVKQFKNDTHSNIDVIFNVFKDEDYTIYERLLK